MEIKNFTFINKGSIIAKFDIFFPSLGITIREFILMEGKQGRFVAPPSRKYTAEDGKKKFYNFVVFADEKKEPFQKKVLLLLEPHLKTAQKPAPSFGSLPEDTDIPF